MVKAFGMNIHRRQYRYFADGQWQGCVMVEAFTPKKYTRTHQYPANTQRIKPQLREKTAIIMLRKIGYPINMLSKALGRSTSFIHRVLRTAIIRLSIRSVDMRKLPSQMRLRCSSIRWVTLQRYLPLWEQFILGERDEPP